MNDCIDPRMLDIDIKQYTLTKKPNRMMLAGKLLLTPSQYANTTNTMQLTTLWAGGYKWCKEV